MPLKSLKMKKIYFLLAGICFFGSVNAQIINFPDANFKAKLLASNSGSNDVWDININPIKVDSNNNGEIEVNEALQVYYLGVYSSNISDFTGIKYFSNLQSFSCTSNINLTNLDLKGLEKLQRLDCSNNSKLANLDLTDQINLNYLDCTRTFLKELNLNNCSKLDEFNCTFNNQLNTIFIKNNVFSYRYYFGACPNLKFICTNENLIDHYKWIIGTKLDLNKLQINSYCSFTPGGTFYTIQGNSTFDIDSNGCDSNDTNYSNLNFRISDGINKGNIISDATGNYYFPVQEGTHTITPILENPDYFTVSPTSFKVTFPTQTSPFIKNFCIRPKGIYKDLEITILPTDPARPGFDATYSIVYKNKGNQTQSGSVVLSFNDAVLDLVSANPINTTQLTDKLTWDYTNLKPLESREITIIFNVNSPMETPAVNNGDRLSFNALITPVAGDEKPVDNSMALRQIVVGSYDPNDKTCLEGDVITPDLIGEYVHYLIRFENTGTYPAENVVIKDLIDLTKFDISTLTPTKASHDYVTKISDGNKVEFIFEKINLPFDDANNDGYIAFKIKTLPTLVVNDTFTNEANIYFDYNFPILTNKAISTFKTLGTSDFEFADYFSLYPNPVNEMLNIKTKNTIEVQSMTIYDVLGQIIIAVPDAKTVSNIDVSKLASGNYFLKMNTNKGISNGKFIKN